MALINLIGNHYGKLTVVERSNNKVEENGKIRVMWLCQRQCGNKKIVNGDSLKRGATTSCGCYHRESVGKRRRIDLTGETYGRLEVISIHHINKKVYWNCLCVCGKTCVVSSNDLRAEKTTSCGCFRKEVSGSVRFVDLTQHRFGNLLVIKRSKKPTNSKSNNSYAYWDCLCDCGNRKIASSSSLNSGDTTSCGCITESYVAYGVKKYLCKYYNAVSEYNILKNDETGYFLPFDVYVPEKNAFIEINGLQHYKFVNAWHRTKERFLYNKKLDRLKRKFARKHGIYIEIDLRKIKTVEDAITHIENVLYK